MNPSPNIHSLANLIVSDPRYIELKMQAYEAVRGYDYIDPSNAFGNYMGVVRFFETLQAWSTTHVETQRKKNEEKEGKKPALETQDPDLI